MENTVNNKNVIKDEEFEKIDFLMLFKRLWSKKIFIIVVVFCFILLGLFYAFSKPNEFTASCTFIPQSSSKQTSGSMSSLAAMAGLNLGNTGSNSDNISPYVYPQILEDVNFKKELIDIPIITNSHPNGITLREYLTDPQYQQKSFVSTIIKYTFGLPGVIMNAIRGEKEEDSDLLRANADGGVVYLTGEDIDVISAIDKNISLVLNDKDGCIALVAKMNNPEMAAGLAKITFDLLESYIINLKIEKAQTTLDYLNERVEEARTEYEEKQALLARYQDANRGITSNIYKTREEQLTNDYRLSYMIYSELSTQQVQVALKVKEDAPVLTIVKAIIVPYKKSNTSKSTLLMVFAFLGGCVSVALVFGFDYIRQSGGKWPKRWINSKELVNRK